MDTEDWIWPSDADKAAVAQTALDAARGAMKGIGGNDEEPEYNHMVRSVLRAFAMANKAQKEADAAFALKHKDNECYNHAVDIHHIVATALVSVLIEAPPDGMPPYSRMGQKVCAFVTACLAINHFNSVVDIMEYDVDASLLFGAGEAESLLLAFDDEDEVLRGSRAK